MKAVNELEGVYPNALRALYSLLSEMFSLFFGICARLHLNT
jgi:hypothetical protein